MGCMTWRGMLISGVGIGMEIIRAPHRLTLVVLCPARMWVPTVWFGAAVTAPSRSAAGRRFAASVSRPPATTAMVSAPSSPQVSKQKMAAGGKETKRPKDWLLIRRSLSRKNLPDDVFDRHFLDVNVRHRQFVEQSFAGRNHAVAFHFERDSGGGFFRDFAVARQIFRRMPVGVFALNGDELEIGEAVHDFVQLAVEK